MVALRSLVCVACALRYSLALSPGLPSGLYGHLVGEGDFELNLQPPQETAQDTKERLGDLWSDRMRGAQSVLPPRLDALVSEANTKQTADSLAFANEKQRMLQSAKAAIRNVVEAPT